MDELMVNFRLTIVSSDYYNFIMPVIKWDKLIPIDELNYEIEASKKVNKLDNVLICITTLSPLKQRKAVEKFALYFKRELGFDFIQYTATNEEESARAYLWIHPCYKDGQEWGDTYYIAVGACCFRRRVWEGFHVNWAMQWIWLHPYVRNQGILKETWSYFKARFGDFFPETPLSDTMIYFLNKNDPDKLPEAWIKRNKTG